MIKKLSLFALIAVAALFSFNAANAAVSQEKAIAHIRVAFNNDEVVVALFDSSASRDLLAQLPLTLEFSDYAGAEKIAYPPKALSTRNAPPASRVNGDFTYYAPWGNIAIFYKGQGSAGGLYVLGRIESGKDKLAAMNRSFNAVIEKVD